MNIIRIGLYLPVLYSGEAPEQIPPPLLGEAPEQIPPLGEASEQIPPKS